MSIDKVKDIVRENTFHRIYNGNIAYTIHKSRNTPDIYYWYLIQVEPAKAKDKVITIHESATFYDIDALLKDLQRRYESHEGQEFTIRMV